MPNQQTRILAATQLQQDKKQELALLTRATQTQTNFDRNQERLIVIADQKQAIETEEMILSRVSQSVNAQTMAQANLKERLTSAHSLNAQKHKEQTAIARSIPQTEAIDTFHYWHNPSKKSSSFLSNKSPVSR